jgi:hypothetical protein
LANISHPIQHFLVQQSLDSSYGNTSLRVPLKQYIGGPVRKLQLTVTLGTLSGGTSPTWNSNAADAIFTGIQLQIDNGVTLKNGTYTSFKTKFKIRNQNQALPYGCHLLEFERPSSFLHASVDQRATYNFLLPADILGQIDLVLNVATLASLTSGSPTSSSGTYVNVTSFEERDAAIRAMQPHFQPLYETEFLPPSLGSGAEIPVDLPRGYIYMNALTEAYDGTSLSDVLIKNYRIVRDNDTDIDNETWFSKENGNQIDLLSSSALGTGLAYTDFIPFFDATVETGNKLTMKMTYGTPSASNSTKWFLEYTVPLSAQSVQAIKQASAGA